MPDAPARPVGEPSRQRVSYLRDPVLAGLGIAALLIVFWFAGPVGTVNQKIFSIWFIQLGCDVTCSVLSLRVSRLSYATPAVRRFWRALGVAAGFFSVGDVSQLFLVLTAAKVDRALLAPSPVLSVASLAGAMTMVVVMLTQPSEGRPRERLCMWLDTGTVGVAAATFGWCSTVQPEHAHPGGVVNSLLTWGLIIGAVFAIVRLLAGGGPLPFTPFTGLIGALAMSTLGAATVFPVTSSGGIGIWLAMIITPRAMLQVAPRFQELQMRADPRRVLRVSRTRRRTFTLLPYAALLFTNGLLVAIVLTGGRAGGPQLLGALTGVILSTGLVVARQVVAFADNAQLLSRLDASMLELQRHEQRIRSLLRHASDVTLIVHDHVVTYASPALERVIGTKPDRLVGRSAGGLIHPEDAERLQGLTEEMAARPGATAERQIRVQHSDGTWRWLEVLFTDLTDDPSIGGLVCNARDITEAKLMHDRLTFQAWHDPLTGLANRALLDERMSAIPHGDEHGRTGILMIDLDDFKAVNDTHGHHAGDALLVAVAGRLSSCVRTGDTIARLGGDEFVILVPRVSDPDIARLIERITTVFDEPIHVDGIELPIRASIGVATGDAGHTERLLRAADSAMYTAKRRGGADRPHVSVVS